MHTPRITISKPMGQNTKIIIVPQTKIVQPTIISINSSIELSIKITSNHMFFSKL